MKFDLLYRKRWWLLYAPVLLLSAMLQWLSYTQWITQPPSTITLLAGQPADGYTATALRYREQLARVGIRADIVTSESTSASLAALRAMPDRPQVALVNGLFAPSKAAGATPTVQDLQGLAVIEREPIWIFTRTPLLTKIQELRGLRVGVGASDALAAQVMQLVLGNAQLSVNDLKIVPVPREQLANQLIDGNIDAAIVLASASSDTVRLLTRSTSVQIIGIDQVRNLLQNEPRLRPFVLPQGVIELRGDIPPRDLTMVASDLQLVIPAQMHPALQRTLIDVANQLHEQPSFLQRQGEFPNIASVDFPVSPVALATLRGDKPFFEQLLPYGWAQGAQWLLFAGLPILLLTALVLAWIPSLFNWRINDVLQNFYGELKFLESEIDPVAKERPIEIKRMLQQLDAIDMQVMQLELPNQYAERWYTLRAHLAQARERLLAMRAR
jgi:TRAP-type uncharacterized transport system substrate-binding protein